jgi:hypothetical protein
MLDFQIDKFKDIKVEKYRYVEKKSKTAGEIAINYLGQMQDMGINR